MIQCVIGLNLFVGGLAKMVKDWGAIVENGA